MKFIMGGWEQRKDDMPRTRSVLLIILRGASNLLQSEAYVLNDANTW